MRIRRKLLPLFVLLIPVVLVIFLLILALRQKSAFSSTDGNRPTIAGAKATKIINREFTFSASSQDKTSLKYVIQNAELRNEIIIQGQKATAIAGRQFLILNIKLTNDQNVPLTVNSKDFVRLRVVDQKELFAPDLNNDPVEVQPISTKVTRLGFPVDESERKFTLEVGELKGNKTQIPLNF